MQEYQIKISDETLNEVESFYGKSDRDTVDIVISNILYRYLNVEHFDPNLSISE